MVIEFVALSPKKEDSNDGDCFCKARASESSDEDTTSSSLLPIPNTLRNELEITLDNFCCGKDFESPKDSVKNLEYPTVREVSIARKIASANILLDDLLAKEPIAFVAKTTAKKPDSETVTDQESSSSTERCRSIPVTPFIFPPPVCECSRCPCERKEASKEPAAQPQQPEPKKPRRRFLLSEKVKLMRLKCRKKKKETLVQQTQTETPSEHLPSTCPYQRFAAGFQGEEQEKCTCPEDAGEDPECNCPVIKQSFKECHCDQKASVAFKECHCDPKASIEPSECQKVPGDKAKEEEKNGDNRQVPRTADSSKKNPPGTPIATVPARKADTRERIDIYYFDHGNSAYYRTTDSHPAKFTEYMIERTDEYATKFWAEVFGTVTIATAFIISFILQLYRCLFTAIIRALTVGLIQIFSDYFFKPLLTVIFNGLIQPCLILGYNIATSTKDFCVPVCEICEFCAKDISIIFRSCRVVEINQKTCSSPSCPCRHNV